MVDMPRKLSQPKRSAPNNRDNRRIVNAHVHTQSFSLSLSLSIYIYIYIYMCIYIILSPPFNFDYVQKVYIYIIRFKHRKN